MLRIWTSNETSSGENIPDMQSHVTQEEKDQPESVRWNETLIADILDEPFYYSPVPKLTFDPWPLDLKHLQPDTPTLANAHLPG